MEKGVENMAIQECSKLVLKNAGPAHIWLVDECKQCLYMSKRRNRSEITFDRVTDTPICTSLLSRTDEWEATFVNTQTHRRKSRNGHVLYKYTHSVYCRIDHPWQNVNRLRSLNKTLGTISWINSDKDWWYNSNVESRKDNTLGNGSTI